MDFVGARVGEAFDGGQLAHPAFPYGMTVFTFAEHYPQHPDGTRDRACAAAGDRGRWRRTTRAEQKQVLRFDGRVTSARDYYGQKNAKSAKFFCVPLRSLAAIKSARERETTD